VSAVFLSFVSAIASEQEQSILTPVQLLWVNLIQDTFAALALATDPPTLTLLHRNPDRRDASIINFNMWKMITGQSVLQLAITLILTFAGLRIFTNWSQPELNTVVFNTYVWLQISNQFNCRRIDNRLNVFSGVHRNFLFLLITGITIVGQIIIVFVGGTAFSVTRLNGEQWAVSIVLGLLSLPFGAIIRVVPNAFLERFIPRRFLAPPAGHFADQEHNELTLVKTVRSQHRLEGVGRPVRRSLRTSTEQGIELSSLRSFREASRMEVFPVL
jgi:P-type Ca2+ transporter type 2C